MTSNISLICTEVVSIRLTAEQKEQIEASALKAKLSPSEWARKTLIEASERSPSEHRILLMTALRSEVNRLSLAAVQDGENISNDKIQQRIETQARVAAEGIVTSLLALGSGL